MIDDIQEEAIRKDEMERIIKIIEERRPLCRIRNYLIRRIRDKT